MTLIDFDAPVIHTQTVTTTAPVVEETVQVNLNKSTSRAFLAKTEDEWSWEDLRDYVVCEIEKRFGPWPRSSFKEAAIFKRFQEQWGAQASVIARYAFDSCDGWWASAPISVNRFTKGCDPYFAQVIIDRLT